MDNLPLISIVTVVYNDVKNIEKTILSVINQSYPYIEYIVIDGNSTDGTFNIINKYSDKLAYIISEPDSGIYYAMNKGMEKASGEWIHFLNSGDIYCNPDVLSAVFNTKESCLTPPGSDGSRYADNELAHEDTDLIYGDIVLKYPFGTVRMDCSPDNGEHSLVRHPCCFIKASVMKKYKYDTQYKISADTCFFNVCKNNNHRFKYIPLCITVFDSYSGLSSKNKLNSYIEDMQISKVKNNSIKWLKGYIKSYISYVIQKINPTVYGRLACYTKRDRIKKYSEKTTSGK